MESNIQHVDASGDDKSKQTIPDIEDAVPRGPIFTSIANKIYHFYNEQPTYSYAASGESHNRKWTCIATFQSISKVGDSRSKVSAREIALALIWKELVAKGLQAQMEKTAVQGEADAVAVVEQGITTIASETPIVPDKVGESPYALSNPYTYDFGLQPILSRMYKIHEFTWGYDSQRGTLLWSANFPSFLLANTPVLLDKMDNFEFFRSSLRLRFFCNGTAMHSGLLQISSLPCNNSLAHNSPSWKLNNLYIAAQCNAHLLDATSNEGVEFTLPYTNPRTYLPSDQWTHTYGNMGSCAIHVLAPLVLTGSVTGGITVTVFAGFENPEIAGPTLQNPSKSHRGLRAQMAKYKKKGEAKAKSVSGLLTSVVEDTVGTAVSTVSGALLPTVGTIASAGGSILTGAAELATVFGFDKPLSIQAPQPVLSNTAPGIATGEGLSERHKLSLIQEVDLANTPESFGDSSPTLTIQEMCAKPGLQNEFTFDGATVQSEQVVARWPVSPAYCPVVAMGTEEDGFTYNELNTPASLWQKNFRYFEGSQNNFIQLTTSKFVSGKIRATVYFDPVDAPNIGDIIDTGVGDMYSCIWDFTGSKSLLFSIPFLSNTIRKECLDPYALFLAEVAQVGAFATGIVVLSVVAPPAFISNVSSTMIHLNHWTSWSNLLLTQMTGFDTKYQSGIYTTTQNLGALQAQAATEMGTSVEAIFKGEFPALSPAMPVSTRGFDGGEYPTSIYTPLHRMVSLKQMTVNASAPASNNNLPFINVPVELSAHADNVCLLNQFFHWAMYWRGSFDINVQRSTVTGVTPVSAADAGSLYAAIVIPQTPSTYRPLAPPTSIGYSYGGSTGVALEDVDLRKGLQVNLPYYNKYAFQETYPLVTPFYGPTSLSFWSEGNTTPANPMPIRVWCAASDDFRMSWFIGAPITAVFVPPPSAVDADNNRVATGSVVKSNNSTFSRLGIRF